MVNQSHSHDVRDDGTFTTLINEALRRPCLVERFEGTVVIEPLQFIPLRHVRPLNRKQIERRAA